MNLSIETLKHAVPAAWRTRWNGTRPAPVAPVPAPERPKPAPAPRRASTGPRVERLFRRYVQTLPSGDHPFSQIRQEFGEWCETGDVRPPSVNQLAAWLGAAGLEKSRRGRAKITTYTKRAARLAA